MQQNVINYYYLEKDNFVAQAMTFVKFGDIYAFILHIELNMYDDMFMQSRISHTS